MQVRPPSARAQIVSDLRLHFDGEEWPEIREAADADYQAGILPRLLTSSNTKIRKGEKRNFKTHVIHLAPSLSSGYTLCGGESLGCAKTCLNTSGHGALHFKADGPHRVHRARVLRTFWYKRNRPAFLAQMVKEIALSSRTAAANGYVPVYRLNATSDVLWERIRVQIDIDQAKYLSRILGRQIVPTIYSNVMELFPWLQFYDYTKIWHRSDIPDNYHLTFSRSEINERWIPHAFENGMNVAVVFRKELPDEYRGRLVVDGDVDDLRFLDPDGVIVGLTAKGKAKKDQSGFVVN